MAYYIGQEDALKIKIRFEIGLGADVVSNDVMDRYLDKALEDVDRLAARISYDTITTVADQADYLIKGNDGTTGHQDLLGVLRVLWSPTTGGYFAQEFGDLGVLGGFSPLASGLSVWDNPSIAEVYFQKFREYKKRFGGNWHPVETITSGGGLHIRLLPAPSTAGTTIPYKWLQQRGALTTEFPFESTIIELAAGYCKKYGGQQINLISKVKCGARSSTFDGNDFVKDGNAMIMRAQGRLRPPLRIRRGSGRRGV